MKRAATASGHRHVTRIELWKAIRRVRAREKKDAQVESDGHAPATEGSVDSADEAAGARVAVSSKR